jgi:mRNA-degrading endonuclease RelE of RelBE toxin-antitoxin system
MNLEQTGEFEKDIKKIDKKHKKILKDAITDVIENPQKYKPLLHYKDIRTVKIEGKRLIYRYVKSDNMIIFLMYKSRDDVYNYLKELYKK